MTDSVDYADLAWPELAEQLRRDPVVLVPAGAIEQHGPHLPLHTDATLATDIARGVARHAGGLVAPALAYGYRSMTKSGGGPGFPGTLNLDGATLAQQMRDVIAELVRHGVRRVCVIDAHFENQWFLTEGIELALRRVGADRVQVMRLEYWDFLTDELLAHVFPDGFPGVALEHAAVLETSLMLHLHPEAVRMDRIPDNPAADFPPYDLFPAAPDWAPSSGALVSARGASEDKGRALYRHYVEAIGGAVTDVLG